MNSDDFADRLASRKAKLHYISKQEKSGDVTRSQAETFRKLVKSARNDGRKQEKRGRQ